MCLSRASFLMETMTFTVPGGQSVSWASAASSYHTYSLQGKKKKMERSPALLVAKGHFILEISFYRCPHPLLLIFCTPTHSLYWQKAIFPNPKLDHLTFPLPGCSNCSPLHTGHSLEFLECHGLLHWAQFIVPTFPLSSSLL